VLLEQRRNSSPLSAPGRAGPSTVVRVLSRASDRPLLAEATGAFAAHRTPIDALLPEGPSGYAKPSLRSGLPGVEFAGPLGPEGVCWAYRAQQIDDLV
jgi:hypothetical protein